VAATNTDILSPTVAVTPGEMFPTDESAVPSAILANLQAKKPMLVYFYDPSAKVSADQRKEIDKALKGYTGTIQLVTFDYTIGLSGTASSSSPDVEKSELLAGALKVNTTPYVILVDGAGRITYRFAGFVDRGLLEREVLRATE
jgi:thioredoxin-like negative regulator of GroEL